MQVDFRTFVWGFLTKSEKDLFTINVSSCPKWNSTEIGSKFHWHMQW